ncbi:homogentisate 1,2-dioxygenase [Aurantiacibacter gangjinensis]|uniref:Homogentisate 1,2-dioxygenase n=1 Tax=Aurantiacibacter gangjinensis TaxID=502682 RepID=A0A0G9MN30_9SPHN|nr:homogentisate 1,2-dioxygenase [Aurantiacibacter gangjinensis]APE28131.1 Homogentisate 1,2-dioxygenase [Aurantiacibacter gangjinensis]KLE32049.1 homogentisate 1,2-dioxygenase [Aurantiacibacter gangjinensis]
MSYQTGFLNHFATEAVEGALPEDRNSPQRPAFGLYAEQFSTSAFTAPRVENRRSWLYRMRPTTAHGAFQPYSGAPRFAAPDGTHTTPNRLRWDPLTMPDGEVDFVDGMVTYGGNGSPAEGGIGIHLYATSASMDRRALQNSDGEMLIVPQTGALRIVTELGRIDIAPGHIGLVPRGMRSRVELIDGGARGYVCENFGEPFRLPDLGPIGANGLANPRDFETPVAWFEDRDEEFEIVQKFNGKLWTTTIDHSPFDVVAWHGNSAPCRYDLARFNTIGTVSFDHPDPSIFTVLTSPSAIPGTANCDFVIFPPRWMVAEDTFRPPWFHRNVMSEFMGLIHGEYDAKEGGGFVPGGASLHNQFNGHGPDAESTKRAMEASVKPHKIEDTLAFMFESRAVIHTTDFAMNGGLLQSDYDACWNGFTKARLP